MVDSRSSGQVAKNTEHEETGEEPVDEARFAERVAVLVERGLTRYADGDLRGAMSDWEHALALDPDEPRAREYMEYVGRYFDVLDQEFLRAKQIAESAAELDVPFGLEREDGAGLAADAYEEIEVDAQGATAAAAPPPDAGSPIDDGWFLGDETPASGAGGAAPRPAPADGGALPPLPGPGPGAASLEFELEAVTAGLEAAASEELGASQPAPAPPRGDAGEAAPGGWRGSEEELTVPGGARGTPPPPQSALSEEALAVIRATSSALPEEPGGEETTGERSSIGARAEIDNLEGLEGEARDDRALASEFERGPRITFRGDRGRRLEEDSDPYAVQVVVGSSALAVSGALDDGNGSSDDELSFDGVTRQWSPEQRGALDEAIASDDAARTGEVPVVRTPAGKRHDARGRPPTYDPALEGAGVIVDASLYAGQSAAADFDDDIQHATREHLRPPPDDFDLPPGGPDYLERVSGQLRATVEAQLDAGEPERERLRRRVVAFIELARAARDRGDAGEAVVAVDLALTDATGDAASQKLIHDHGELLTRIYHEFIGDLSRTPCVALPMHEVTAQSLDHRAAFLLSRIDGTLTLDELLDVAGMPVLEALQHVVRLLLCGIVDLR